MKNILYRILIFTIFCTTSLTIKAGEGMWLPIFLKSLNEAEMQALGMKITAEDIYSVNKGSLKDAVVHFGGFCTGEIISNQGLLLTNHHCGYSNIQSHSSVNNNLLKNGFWAKNHGEELPNPDLFVTFIDKIEDITAIALVGTTDKMSIAEKQSIIQKNLDSYKAKMKLSKFNEVVIRPFYAGNQYFAFFTTRYNDVRLVGTPPESIGKFGSDTDNWVWPRHTGDFSMFRVYAGPDNQPADYNIDNKPYEPKHHLPISMDGVTEGDFTMVFGFPGRTDQYLPSAAVRELVNNQNPAKIKIRDTALKIINKYMRADEAVKIQYAAKYANVANYWKKWIGESLGLEKSNAIEKKQRYEADFIQRAKPTRPEYSNILSDFDGYYNGISESALVLDYYSEIGRRNVELMGYLASIKRLITAYENNGESGYASMLEKMAGYMDAFYKDYRPNIDKEVAESLFGIYYQDIDRRFHPSGLKPLANMQEVKTFISELYTNSKLTTKEGMAEILSMAPAEAVLRIKGDPAYNFADDWATVIAKEANPTHTKYKSLIDSLQSVYMRAQMELFPEKKFYPDANSTMRVTYGQVEGFQPEDGKCYTPLTYLDGAISKYVPGDYEFDLPQGLLDLHKRKEYGPYADHTGKVPLCFLGSNHTTGGNSGSPAIDAYGNLVGLNFDRVWEGTMSDINYDISLCRNIMVDTRFILFVVDKYAGATHLVNEMTLVHPKAKMPKGNSKKKNKKSKK